MLSLPLRLLRYTLHVVFWAAIVIATLLLVRAFDARGLPPIEAWHRALPGEFRAADAEQIGGKLRASKARTTRIVATTIAAQKKTCSA